MELVKRQMNKECPIIKPRDPKPPKLGLTQILERDENGKPKLDLTPLEGTAVHVPTQEECDELMQVYELGDWKWCGGDLPTSLNHWYKEETCVDAGIGFLNKKEKQFGYGDNEFYIKENLKVLSTSEFYDIEKINLEMRKEINKYFESKNL
ncbi:hypothetical protein KAT36_04455 [Candidatus Pacearchaeota archaeon]|nr:hypothetical protein [Candidatus Pacearchaeota archaeon]